MTRIAIVRDLAGIAGASLISAGVGMIHLPSGLIAAGVMMLAGAIAAAR
jgi:hypothetical protein